MADDILKTLIAEAYGEGPEGMRRVAETIINRAAIRGLTPEQVVRQANQYTGLTSPGPDAKKAWNDPQAIAAAQAAWELAQQPGDPTGGADHYYAQGTIAQPWWASSMTPKGEYGGHTFFSSRPIPPGELPEVATALSTVPTPRIAPAVPSRRPDSLNGLHPFDAATNTPRPNADGSVSTEVTRTVQLPSGEWVNVPSLWWGQGSTVRDFGSMGDDQLADFASRYEKSTGNAFPRYASIPEAERAAIARSNEGGGTNGPITYPGNMVDRAFAQLPKSSRTLADEIAMAPIQGGQQKAPMFDAAYDQRVGAMRLTPAPIDSQGMAVGSSRPPAPIPAIPSPQLAARRATDPVLQAALNERYPPTSIGQAPTTRPVATTTVRPSASDLVRGNPMQTKNVATTIASIPTTDMSRLASLYAGGGPTRPPLPVPDRLPTGFSIPGPGDLQAASFQSDPKIASQEVIGFDASGKPIFRPSVNPVQVAQAPMPRPRPDFLPAVATALAVKPLPPMPIPRPVRAAPPMPQRPPLSVVINGANPIPRAMSPVAQYQAMNGGSSQQAYDAVNRAAVERAIANSSNPDAARRLNERLGNL